MFIRRSITGVVTATVTAVRRLVGHLAVTFVIRPTHLAGKNQIAGDELAGRPRRREERAVKYQGCLPSALTAVQ
jgi:hypothetical protein